MAARADSATGVVEPLTRHKGIGGHHSHNARTHEWYTPPEVFEALSIDFDLDPASPKGGLSWIPAKRFLSIEDDGLTASWDGRVWLNPPYGPHAAKWMRRLAAHGDGIALVFARTETRWWHESVPSSHAVCFIEGRLTFLTERGVPAREEGGGNSGAPSALIAYGEECAEAIARSGLGMTFAVRGRPLLGQASLWEAA